MDKGKRIIPGNGTGVRERLGWATPRQVGPRVGGDVSKLLRLEKMPGGPVVRPLSQSGPCLGVERSVGSTEEGPSPNWKLVAT